MRPQLVLLLGLALGAVNAKLVQRQNDDDESSTVPSESSTTEPPEESTTTTTSEEEQDTTVTRTVTVDGEQETITRATTTFTTTITTITVTDTEVETETVTSTDGGTATSVVFETTTIFVRKRSIDMAPRTLAPGEVEAVPTPEPTAAYQEQDLRLRAIAKRDTITVIRTVTGDSEDDATTVLNTITQTVRSTRTVEVTTTSTLTITEQANASETVTVTSTITTTAVNTDAQTTGPAETGGADSDNSDDDDEGLSTGAQVGIGVGAGVVGLAIIGGLIWWFMRRRRNPRPDHDDLIGASEVPVGDPIGRHGLGGGSTAGMAEHATAAAFLAPSRTATKPNAPEGYRGTAMGDGRAGYAKPAPYGAAYTPYNPSSGTNTMTTASYSQATNRNSSLMAGDQLPLHPSPSPVSPVSAELGQGGAAAKWQEPNATEIDSRAVTNQHTGPVYEMPGQHYR